MPIASLICRRCGGEVPLDHFETTECGDYVHPDYVSYMIGDRINQKLPPNPRVSHGLGCPRKAAIENKENYSVDPLDANPALTGTAWHAMMEKFSIGQSEVSLSGVVLGININGTADRLRGKLIEDWKHISDDNLKYIRKDGAKKEHVVQVSIYAELCAQSNIDRPERGIIWYHTSKPGADGLTPVSVDLMGLSEALTVRPYDGEFSVGELYQQMDSHLRSGVKWQDMPLAGESMSFGPHSACKYCSVRNICTMAENGAPF